MTTSSAESANMLALSLPTATVNRMVMSDESPALDLQRMEGDDHGPGLGHAHHPATTTVDTILGGIIDPITTIVTEQGVGKIGTQSATVTATTHLAMTGRDLDPGHRIMIKTAVPIEGIIAAEQQDTMSALRINDMSETADIKTDRVAAEAGTASTGHEMRNIIEAINADESIAGHYHGPARHIHKNDVDYRHHLAVRFPRHDVPAAQSGPGKTQVHLVNRSALLLVLHRQSTSTHCARCPNRRDFQTERTTHTPVQYVQANLCETWVSPRPTCRQHENSWRWMQSRIKRTKSEQTRRSGGRLRA